MKNKLVVWGTNTANEKVLIALELSPDTNKVMLYTFPEAIANEDFVTQMMNEWRTGTAVEFPEGHTSLERELSVTENLLPDDLKVEREDLIQRAQTEWHFVVLSSKLHKAYEEELAEFKEKIAALSAYDNNVWDSLKGFWDKVQEQARDRNLFREHADGLRDDINALFDDMKKMRAKVQDEFMEVSKGVFEEFSEKLAEVEKRIQAGGGKLNSVFDELKALQRKYRESKMSNEHRNKLWDRLDGAFKAAKERKFGPGANEGSLAERHERRLSGLMEAIKRMEESVRRDEEELNFQRKKVAVTEGQLEAQIRNAKIKMVEERLVSKRDKLAEMNQTRAGVEKQINQAKDKEDKRVKMEAAKIAAKEAIAAEVKTSTLKPDADTTPVETPVKEEKEESLLGALGNVLGETFEDVSTTVMAVTAVLGDKAAQAIDEAIEKVDDFVDEMKKDTAEAPASEETATEQAEPKAEAKPAKAKKKAAKAETAPDEPEADEKKDE